MGKSSSPEGSTAIDPSVLQDWVRRVFMGNGLSDADAETAAAALVTADLRGVDSHGVARVPMYCERLRRGVTNPRPRIEIQQVAAAASWMNGDDGIGLVVGKAGMVEAIRLAEASGIGLTGVRRSGHYGMGALYVLQAIDAGCIGMAFTNASPALPAWGGRAAFLGTSPFAAGAPAGKAPPFVLDMACSVVARGRLKFAAQRGEPIPEGLALDREGRPTTDGAAAFEGVVLPFGGYKGAGLSLLMEVLSGVFTGAAFGGEVRNPFTGLDGPQGTGHFFLAARADLFLPMDLFMCRMETLVHRVKNQPLAEGFDEIFIPGEPGQRTAENRRQDGIPLTPDVAAALTREGELVGEAFPLAPGS